jgi:BolA protein
LTFVLRQRSFKGSTMTVSDTIRAKLTAAFAPAFLDVADESARHAGHSGATRDDGSHGETHFHVRIVSDAFEGVGRVERQRRVYAALDAELKGTVHALSLSALTPTEASKP